MALTRWFKTRGDAAIVLLRRYLAARDPRTTATIAKRRLTPALQPLLDLIGEARRVRALQTEIVIACYTHVPAF